MVPDDFAVANMTVNVNRNPNAPVWVGGISNYQVTVNASERTGFVLVNVEAQDILDGVSIVGNVKVPPHLYYSLDMSQ